MKKRYFYYMIIFCFILAGWAGAEEGVSDTEIHIGQFGPLTGYSAPWGQVLYGSGLAFDMVNEQGGIHGRKIVYHQFDDRYNPARTKYGVKQLQESQGIFVWGGGVGTLNGLAVMDYLMNRNIPWVAPASGSDAWVKPPKKYLFGVYPFYKWDAQVLARYAVNELKLTKIAVIYQNDYYGHAGLKGVSEELKQHNMSVFMEISLEKTDSERLMEYALTLRKAQAEAVIIWVNPFHALRLLSICNQMQFYPQWMAGSTFSDFPYLYKLSRGLIKGLIAATSVDLTDTPELRKYKEAHQRLGKQGVEWGVFYQAGIGFADIMTEAIRRSGRNLTRDRFVSEMENIDQYKTVLPPISFKPYNPQDPTTRQGLNQVFLMRCLEDGKHEILTDWVTF